MIKANIVELHTDGTPARDSSKRLSLELEVDKETDLCKDFISSSNESGIVSKLFIYRPEDIPAPWAFIKDVYVNEYKKTVVVKFKDGAVVKKTACEEDTFDVYAGVALCLAAYMAGSTKNFHKYVDKRLKVSEKQKSDSAR